MPVLAAKSHEGRISAGDSLLEAAAAHDTGRVKARLAHFAAAHRALSKAQQALDAAESTLSARRERVAERDVDQDDCIDRVASALIGDGLPRVNPSSVAFTDLFGLTRVAIAQAAEARLRVLPRLYPVALASTPRTLSPQEGVLSVLRRAPTEDWFRVREYMAGDDTRRIHWKLSVKLGHLQVRQPETVPVVRRRVRVVLDNYLPAAHAQGEEVDLVLGDVLDRLVELWISLARALSERGESVQLAVATGEATRTTETLELTRGAQPRLLELGSRVQWQSATDFHEVGDALERGQAMVVVTARFLPLPPLPPPSAGTVTWVLLPVADEIPTALPRRAVDKVLAFFTQPFAPGAEENALLASAQRNNARRRLETVRAHTAHLTAQGSAAAEAALRARGEPFYRVSRSGVAYLLG